MALLLLASSPARALIVFGSPAALHDTAVSEVPDVDSQASLAHDGASGWVAAWYSQNTLGGTIGTDFDILVSTSADDGESWSNADAALPNAATDAEAVDTAPKVEFGNGVFVMAFVSSNDLGATIGTDQDILFTRSLDGGATWSAAALLNSGGSSDTGNQRDEQPSIATDGAGNWLVVWRLVSLSAPTGHQVYFSYSIDDGQTWAAQQPLGGLQNIGTGNGQGTSVAWTGSGFVAAWGSSEAIAANGTDGDVLYSTIAVPAFTASAPALLNDSGAADAGNESDSYPTLSADGSTVVAAWQSNANIGGTGTDNDIFYARSTDGGSTWSATAALGTNAGSDTGEDVSVAVAHDGDTFLAVWSSTDPLGKLAKTDADIFAARSDDGGATWSAPGILASNAGKDKGADTAPAIAANAATGTWNVAWESADTLGNTLGGDKDILFVHSSIDCPAVPVSSASCIDSIVAGSSLLLIKEGGDRDSFLWKFLKGDLVDKAADLGSPDTSDDYVLCIYDETLGTPELLSEIDLEAGGNCFVKPCWSDTGNGFKFKNKYGVATGAVMTAGAAGTSKIQIKGKGAFQAQLPLVQDTAVSVRLHNLGNGKCFANDFSTSQVNSADQFKATSN
ncbi:MAG: sialidase family protein [Candidatus Binatia bacterium]